MGDFENNYTVLSDLTKKGKERPWSDHKVSSMLLAKSYKRLGYHSKAERVCECGSQLKFNVCPSGHEKKLSWANFCRVRLCAMCGWRKSLLNAHQVRLVAHEAVKRQKLRWLFLTLTVKNPTGDKLEEEINNMSNAFKKMIRRKRFSENVVGFFRVLEVTRNHKRNNYHPHYHILLAVRPSYFGKKYITQSEWQQLWKESLKVDYDPVVDIRAVKDKRRNKEKEKDILGSKGIGITANGLYEEVGLPNSAISEVAKYSVKSSDFIRKNNPKLTDEIVSVLDKALSYKRLLGYGGLLKEIWQELRDQGKLEDAEDEKADLIHTAEETECKCSVCGSDMLEELYTWIPGKDNYFKKNNPAGQQD